MRLKRSIVMLAYVFIGAHAAFGQDLSQLPGRAAKLWELRKQSNKLEALQFIDPDTHKTYLQRSEPPILDFKVTGLEFTEDRNRVEVVLRVRSILPQLGEMDLIIREPWVWKDRKWSMQATASTTPFSATTNTRTGEDRMPPKFEITSPVVDLGTHSQGDIIDGKIPFRADRNEIRTVTVLRDLTGLVLASPVWITPSEGYLPYTWATTLVSRNVSENISLVVLGVNDGRTSIDVRFQLHMNGKVAFKQAPELIDTTEAGQAELRIENLTSKPLEILSVLSYNSSFVVPDEGVPGPIEPGKTGSLVIRYSAQQRPIGASLALVLSERLGPSPTITIPLNVKSPKEEAPGPLTRDELERVIKSTPKPNVP